MEEQMFREQVSLNQTTNRSQETSGVFGLRKVCATSASQNSDSAVPLLKSESTGKL